MGSKQAFSLIEYLVYLAVFSLLAITIASLTVQFINVAKKTIALREIQDSARGAMETITEEIRQAKGVYTPTSVFAATPGQLSLETKNNLPAQETSTYVDFYVDGGGIYIKRENQNPARLTSKNVTVQTLTFLLLNQATTPALRIQVSLQSSDLPGSSFTFTTTASLRPQS